MRRRRFSRLFAMLMVLAMMAGMFAGVQFTTVKAADGDTGETTTSGIELSKTATLENDGTYTINLEAYATGETTTTTTTSSVPLDIVLVIDQSGSMTDTITSSVSYTARDSQGYTYSNLSSSWGQSAPTYYYLAEDGNYYQVKQGSQSTGSGFNRTTYYYLYYTDANGSTVYLSGTGTSDIQPTNVTSNSTTIWIGVLYTATTTTTTKLAALKDAVTSFVETIQEDAETNGVDHRIAIAGFASNSSDGSSGYGDYTISSGSSTSSWINTGLFVGGYLTNYGSLQTSDYTSALVSVNSNGSVASSITTAIGNFAASGATRTQYGIAMANNVFANNSNTYTDEDGNTVTRKRIVVVFTDGQPGQSSYDGTEANSAISAAYTTKSTYGATVYSVGLYTTTQSDNVTNFMNYISSNYPNAQSTTNTGDKEDTKYYMTASNATELSNIFESITSDATSSSTTVTLGADAVMKDIMGENFTLTDDSEVTIKTVAGTADTEGNITWGTETSSPTGVTSDISGNTVSVTGFDYADKYISSGHAGEKICVTITGVLPTENATTGEAIYTNDATSGIYASATATEAAAYFPVPDTIITTKTYVLDYGLTANLTVDQDKSLTGLVDAYQAVYSTNSAVTLNTLKYGKPSIANNVLSYKPTTMQWDGTDSFYVFGVTSDETIKSYSANSNGNLWSKVNVIPANSVYYEDDFTTNTTDGIVGITYSGTWTTVTGNSNATQSDENVLYGTDATYADDTAYSNGSVHSATFGATATFTFTGTGVDIYSSTTSTACIVYAYLYEGDSTSGTLKQYAIANNYADDGQYYVVPTVAFSDLTYGTYTVKLTVLANSSDSSAITYYIDGIRVYNPLGTVTNDGSIAGNAYAEAGELNAVFTELRSMLLDESADLTGGDGALFIDEITDETTGETTTDLSTYESDGPEHEVYLKVENGVAFTLSGFDPDSDAVYVGIKLTGITTGDSATSGTVEVTNGSGKTTLEITSTADQYYKITPDSNGNIVIKNTSSTGAVISLTKVRTTSTGSAASANEISIISDENTVVYALTTFNTLTATAYEGNILDEEDVAEEQENSDNTDSGEEEDTSAGDVEIENPDDGASEESDSGSDSQSIFSKIFDKIIGWFSGRR